MKKRLLFIILFFAFFISLFFENDPKSFNITRPFYKGQKYVRSSDYLIDIANSSLTSDYEYGDKHQMYGFKSTVKGEMENYRFIGREANNYVYFNCSNEEDNSTCEVWRIIGVFQVQNSLGEKEYRLKLVKNESIGKYNWNDNNNNWINSSLIDYLNNGEYYLSLNDNTKNMIESTKYYYGNINVNIKDGEEFYKSERQLNTEYFNVGLLYPSDYLYTYAMGANKDCYSNINYCENKRTSWMYKIASNPLWTMTSISDSDDVFVISNNNDTSNDKNDIKDNTDNNTKNKDDIKENTDNDTKNKDDNDLNNIEIDDIDIQNNNDNLENNIEEDIEINYNSISNSYDVYPVVYLKYNVSFTSGNGCQGDPYSMVLLNNSDLQTEEDVINNMDESTDKSNVNVGDTSSTKSLIVIIISILLVATGIVVFTNNYIKSRKEKLK